MAFATAEELASFLQEATVDTYTAEQLLDLASDAIRMATGQQIDRVTDDVVSLPAPYGTELVLLQRPADEPTAITVGADAVTDWSFDGFYTLTRPGGWLAWDSTSGALLPVSVTYSHGFTTIPKTIKGLCLQAAARAFRNPAGLRSSQRAVDDYSKTDTYASETLPLSVDLTDGEVAQARRALGIHSAYVVCR
jgi:hypothetical protein